jgi:excisionase family DNA binding protein
MNIKEVSEYTHLAPQTIYNLIHTKKIPFRRVSPKKVIFDKREIDKWIEERGVSKKSEEEQRELENVTRRYDGIKRGRKRKKVKRLFVKLKHAYIILPIISLMMLAIGWMGRIIYENEYIKSLKSEISDIDYLNIESLIENAKIGNLKMSESLLEDNQVKIKLDYINDVELEGNVNSDYIRPLLIYTLKNRDESYAIRSKTIDIVKPLIYEQEIRTTLIQVLEHDKNAAIRMKAATVLAKVAEDREVKKAILDRIKNDNNVGVRFKALEILEKIVDKEIILAIEKAKAHEKSEIIKRRQELILNKYSDKL